MSHETTAAARTNGDSPRPDVDLTVLIPTYRCAPYLPAAVESALHSPAGTILITDDGSGLDVPRIAQQYERDHPGRVRVLYSRRRRGVARNINEAVRHIRTPYFAKLDGDDVLIPGHLEAAFRLIAQRSDVGVVAGHEVRMAQEEMLQFRAESCPKFTADPAPRILSGIEAYEFILKWSPNPCSSGAIYRTEAFREIGGFDPAIGWGEDWEIWLRFAQRWSVAYCHAPSALYRIHEQSSTAKQQRQSRLCFGYDAVYRRGAELCKAPQIEPLLRELFLRVAGLYCKAAPRQLLRLRGEGFVCVSQAMRALLAAAAPHRARFSEERKQGSWTLLWSAGVMLLGILLLYSETDLARHCREYGRAVKRASQAIEHGAFR